MMQNLFTLFPRALDNFFNELSHCIVVVVFIFSYSNHVKMRKENFSRSPNQKMYLNFCRLSGGDIEVCYHSS